MKKSPFFSYLYIDYHSATPKYIQFVNCVIRAINAGAVKENEILPSINEISFEIEVSRDTVERGYKHLKTLGILGSVAGKGFFVKTTPPSHNYKILLLFNKLSVHKKVLYDSFAASIGELGTIDFYVYNNDLTFFKKLITQKINDYTHYVIVPHFMENAGDACEIINTIPKEKLVLLDKLVKGVTGTYGAVYEDFEEDIYSALQSANEQLSKYQTIKLIFPEYSYYPKEIVKGFLHYCQEYAFNYKVVHKIADEAISKGDVFINLMEDDLVILIEKLINTDYKLGVDVGVISYNETTLKKIILNGITTISSDFDMMGKKAAEMVLQHAAEHILIPFKLTLRASL